VRLLSAEDRRRGRRRVRRHVVNCIHLRHNNNNNNWKIKTKLYR
jgi:hypothetical protein